MIWLLCVWSSEKGPMIWLFCVWSSEKDPTILLFREWGSDKISYDLTLLCMELGERSNDSAFQVMEF